MHTFKYLAYMTSRKNQEPWTVPHYHTNSDHYVHMLKKAFKTSSLKQRWSYVQESMQNQDFCVPGGQIVKKKMLNNHIFKQESTNTQMPTFCSVHNT